MSDIKIMPWSEWVSLPLATREMLLKIGYPEPKEPLIHKAKREPISKREADRRAFKRATCPSEYTMELVEKCQCCGTQHKRQLWMKRNSEGTALVSRACSLLGPADKKKTVDTYSCVSCHVVLMEKPKSELVAMILAINDERQYAWPSERPEDTNAP